MSGCPNFNYPREKKDGNPPLNPAQRAVLHKTNSEAGIVAGLIQEFCRELYAPHGTLLVPQGGVYARMCHPGGVYARMCHPGGYIDQHASQGGYIDQHASHGGYIARYTSLGGYIARYTSLGGYRPP